MDKERWVMLGLLGLLFVLYTTELVFSSLGGLLSDVPALAEAAGLTTEGMNTYLTGLALLDLFGVVGTAVSIWFWRKPTAPRFIPALRFTALVTILYAVYQGLAGILLLSADLRPAYLIIGAVYLILGNALFFLERRQAARLSSESRTL